MLRKVLLLLPLILIVLSISYHDAEARKPVITKAGPPMPQRLLQLIPHTWVPASSYTANNHTYTPIIPSNNTIPTKQISKSLTFNILEIIRSQVCNIESNAGIKTSCPSIKQLIPFDTSNQLISGKFENDSKGNYIRTDPQVKNNWLFYNHTIVCVECHTDLFRPDVVKEIIIEPHGFTFINKTEVSKDGSYTTYKDRYFAGCNTVTMSYDPQILKETIAYMLNNCVGKIHQDNSTNIRVLKPFNIQDSLQWAYNQYLIQAENQSLGDCIHYHCNVKSYGNKFNP